MTTSTPPAATWKIRSERWPLIASRSAPGPSMVRLLSITSSPWDRRMVPERSGSKSIVSPLDAAAISYRSVPGIPLSRRLVTVLSRVRSSTLSSWGKNRLAAERPRHRRPGPFPGRRYADLSGRQGIMSRPHARRVKPTGARLYGPGARPDPAARPIESAHRRGPRPTPREIEVYCTSNGLTDVSEVRFCYGISKITGFSDRTIQSADGHSDPAHPGDHWKRGQPCSESVGIRGVWDYAGRPEEARVRWLPDQGRAAGRGRGQPHDRDGSPCRDMMGACWRDAPFGAEGTLGLTGNARGSEDQWPICHESLPCPALGWRVGGPHGISLQSRGAGFDSAIPRLSTPGDR